MKKILLVALLLVGCDNKIEVDSKVAVGQATVKSEALNTKVEIEDKPLDLVVDLNDPELNKAWNLCNRTNTRQMTSIQASAAEEVLLKEIKDQPTKFYGIVSNVWQYRSDAPSVMLVNPNDDNMWATVEVKNVRSADAMKLNKGDYLLVEGSYSGCKLSALGGITVDATKVYKLVVKD